MDASAPPLMLPACRGVGGVTDAVAAPDQQYLCSCYWGTIRLIARLAEQQKRRQQRQAGLLRQNLFIGSPFSASSGRGRF
jgi:hypothetical protein